MFTTTLTEMTHCNTCNDGTGASYLLVEVKDYGQAIIKFMQPGTNTASRVRIWLNNGKDQNDPANNHLQHEESLPANTRNKTGIARLHNNSVQFRVRKGMRIYATLLVAQPEPIVALTTIESQT